ncbi:MAG: HAD-like domain-containing protein, partial [Benjaminiella poitrasii]
MDINLNQKPIEDYLQLSNHTSIRLPLPFIKKQLLILDLNGTLICRPKGAAGSFYLRHHHTTFFDYIFSNFTVMVWSSAQEKSVKSMVKALPNTLRLIWNRSHFDLEPAAFNSAAETIKDLDKVWEVLPEFNASNTIVLDDTAVKLIKQPFNLVKVRTFEHNAICDHELYHVIEYLKMLQMETNVANFMKENPY